MKELFSRRPQPLGIVFFLLLLLLKRRGCCAGCYGSQRLSAATGLVPRDVEHPIKRWGSSSVLSLPLLCFQHGAVKRKKMLPAPQLVQSDGLLTAGFSAAGEGWTLFGGGVGGLLSHTPLERVSGSNGAH